MRSAAILISPTLRTKHSARKFENSSGLNQTTLMTTKSVESFTTSSVIMKTALPITFLSRKRAARFQDSRDLSSSLPASTVLSSALENSLVLSLKVSTLLPTFLFKRLNWRNSLKTKNVRFALARWLPPHLLLLWLSQTCLTEFLYSIFFFFFILQILCRIFFLNHSVRQ